jgi:6-phosphogluconate dehydrogenase
MPEKEMGVVGLGTIGGGLARNLASHGVRVAVYNRTHHRTEEFIADHGKEGEFVPAATFEELARALKPPRAVAVLVNAGRPTDDVIDALTEVLDKGDMIIDGGNSFFQDTQRRTAALEKLGFGFLGCGVSGGEEGALRGPSLMPGGTRQSYERVAEMLNAIAA